MCGEYIRYISSYFLFFAWKTLKTLESGFAEFGSCIDDCMFCDELLKPDNLSNLLFAFHEVIFYPIREASLLIF